MKPDKKTTITDLPIQNAGLPGPKLWIQRLNQVTRMGITFHFLAPTMVAFSMTGDPMVGPGARISKITPRSQRLAGGRIINGAMLSPTPGLRISQGFDSSMGKPASGTQYQIPYVPALNVGQSIADGSVLTMQPGDSLVASISDSPPGSRPSLKSVAVLSCVEVLPFSFNAFRPALVPSATKAIPLSFVDLKKLPTIQPPKVLELPDLTLMASNMEGTLVDYMDQWPGRYTHALSVGPDYGRDIASQHHAAIIASCLPVQGQDKKASRERLVYAVIQRGIDIGENAKAAGEGGGESTWMNPDGGHHSGRKALAVFAALMLGDPSLALAREGRYAEDESLDYIQASWVGRYPNYTQAMVGLPEWRQSPVRKPDKNDGAWKIPYRRVENGAVWWGAAAFLKASLEARDLWGSKAQLFLDYMDRFEFEESSRATGILVPFTQAYDGLSKWARRVWMSL